MNTTRNHAPQEAWDRPFVKEHQEWCDDLVLELRLRDVPGSVIGDHLAEVETHCAETREAPHEAFGEPIEYARQLAEESEPEPVTGVWTVALLSAAQVLALLVGTSAAWAWARGEELSYNAVQVGSLAVLVGVLLALPTLLRPLVNRPWSIGLPVLALGVLAGLGSAAGAELDLPALLTLPAAAVTVGLFVVVLVLAAAEFRELSGEDDRVVSPLTAAPSERPRALRPWLPAIIIPVSYVVLTGVALLAG